ncbi:MAG TPA: hypothetical protein VN495_01380 [Candidatus Paceibacterota bacterium]|nr:hypothetical protein [Candidatus Paceibacterota bacterium]
MIEEFFAVTRTSVYHARHVDDWRANVIKIALRGSSEIPLYADICEGGMIAVGRNLQAFIPERFGRTHIMTAYERCLEKVNTSYWGLHSSLIIGLFKTKEEALACFEVGDGTECDTRWIDSTRAVVAEIGDDHPSIYVSHDKDFQIRI